MIGRQGHDVLDSSLPFLWPELLSRNIIFHNLVDHLRVSEEENVPWDSKQAGGQTVTYFVTYPSRASSDPMFTRRERGDRCLHDPHQ